MKDIAKLKELRKKTGLSLKECAQALEDSGYDVAKAQGRLRQKAADFALKKAHRETRAGIIDVYSHANKKAGAMIQLMCETDFVAKNPEFQKLAHELCLQVAAMNPLYVSPEDIEEEFLAGQKEIFKNELKSAGTPQKLLDQILANKVKTYAEEISLLCQPWIKDPGKRISDLVNEFSSRVGEKVVVSRFSRFAL